ncbi:hypothetical protein ABT294_44020 [Nonomuraea sp. NPDC000554]|uniref:hypothetical protein n=1 Tax=Nonomuraea sp. NPDC000554 TaxID=3154259 RepID=UPI0033208860
MAVRRLGGVVILLSVLSVLTYGLLVLAPGGPEEALLGQRASTPRDEGRDPRALPPRRALPSPLLAVAVGGALR